MLSLEDRLQRFHEMRRTPVPWGTIPPLPPI
jgi:hypothetical protein